ncbi:MAG: hypothetical protein LUD68_09400 [Rikenellaceae bacterium]|nr:hypothetical protein [Rikenellaceae bacterium]
MKQIKFFILIILLSTACRQKHLEIEVVSPLQTTVKFSVEVQEFTAREQTSTELLPEERRIFNYAGLIFDAQQKLEAFLTASPYSPDVPGSEGVDCDGTLLFTDENGQEQELRLTAGKKYLFALLNAPQPVLLARDRFLQQEEAWLEDLQSWIFEAGPHGGMEILTGKTSVPQGDERGFMMTTKEGL